MTDLIERILSNRTVAQVIIVLAAAGVASPLASLASILLLRLPFTYLIPLVVFTWAIRGAILLCGRVIDGRSA